MTTPPPPADVEIHLPSGARLLLCHAPQQSGSWVTWAALPAWLGAVAAVYRVLPGSRVVDERESDRRAQAMAEARGYKYDSQGRCLTPLQTKSQGRSRR